MDESVSHVGASFYKNEDCLVDGVGSVESLRIVAEVMECRVGLSFVDAAAVGASPVDSEYCTVY